MIRVLLVALVAAAAAAAIVVLTGDPGHASMIWLGWRVDMTAAAAVLILLLGGLVGALLWRGLIWVVETPKRAARARSEARRKQGLEALSRGFLAAAAGDGADARRLAVKAAEFSDDTPAALARVLAAQAAEASGDSVAARAAYNAMLGFPEMRLAGLRGLMQASFAEGDRAQALAHARTAYGLAKTAPWAWRALLDDRLEDGDWTAALELVASALDRKAVSPIMADRARAALLSAAAASLEPSSEADDRARALDYALQAVKSQPVFAPGAVMAARLLAAEGKGARAGAIIEQAWKTHPHPALWLAFRDLRTQETKPARAQRLASLAALNPEARESRFLQAEQALLTGDFAAARAAAALLDANTPTARVAGLMARIAYAADDADEARAWIARSAGAPQEPDWSDLDPEGRAFAYTPQDWARLVATYAETGELIHPRLERQERVMSELPQLPAAYTDSTPFVRAVTEAAAAMPIPDDPGVPEAPQPAPNLPKPPPARRRLPTRPRASK
jgi:HemY protein